MSVLNSVRTGLNVIFTPVLYGVVASIAIQLSTYEKGDRAQDKFQMNTEPKVDTFDFIIVGGGTGGCLTAARLSKYYSVLLLEAGGDPSALQYVPGLSSHIVNRPETDWMYKTVAQKKSSKLSLYKRLSLAAGKNLGGSSNLNFMMHLRGSPKDFDNWAKLVDDNSWSYENFLPYFQRHENFIGNTTDPAAHAKGGELTVQLPDYRPLASEFVRAGQELGYPNVDLNGRFTEGFDETFSPIRKGEKQTAYKAFVEPIKKRPNLTIRRFSTVTKILLRQNDKSAYGVEYERHGTKYNAYVYKEVILAAGAIQTPRILMLSGVGPRKHLEDIGIKVVSHLPVGRNLQDHVAVPVGPFFIREPYSFSFDKDVSAQTFFDYGSYGKGPLTSGGFQAVGLFGSSYATLRGEKGWPDLQLLLHGVSVDSKYSSNIAHMYGLQEEALKKYYKHATGKHSFHIYVGLGRPYSRGEVRLASRNPTAPLIIDPKYLDDPWDFDLKVLAEGIQKAVELVESTTAFQALEAQFTPEILPGCESARFRSNDYWKCYATQYLVSLNNLVGTCSMSNPGGGGGHAVVDSDLRVIGIKNVRVIDASVMPAIVATGTQAAVLAIAEKGSESVLNDWKNKNDEGQDPHNFQENVSSTPTSPPTTKPPPPPSTTTKEPYQTAGSQQQFQFSVNQNQNWQNTLDSIAAFSKSIQQTFNLPTTTTTASSTTAFSLPVTKKFTTPKSKPFKIQQTLFHTTAPKYSALPATYKSVLSPPSTTAQTPFDLPTETQVITTAPPVTTYRPIGDDDGVAFSVNIPIIKASYKPFTYKPTIQTQPTPVKVYNAPSTKLIQSIIRKEQIYQQQLPTTPRPTMRPTTRPTTTIPTTTYRPLQYVHDEVLQGYQNLVDIPISIDYVDQEGTTPAGTISPIRFPAVTLRKPMETTTTRIITPIHIQHSVSEQRPMFLAGLEPLRIEQVTAQSIPVPTASIISPTAQAAEEISSEVPLGESPIFYVVRKKNKNNQIHQYKQQRPDHMRHEHPPQRPYLRKPPRAGRRPNRPPPQYQNQLMMSQSQRHMPNMSLPPFTRGREIMDSHSYSHDPMNALGSSRVHSIIKNPMTSRHAVDDGVEITPAISSQLFQQNVLNQLIPIH